MSITASPPIPRDAEGYRTAPDQTNTGWPPGVPYIVGNEACERFSFYGMRAILYVHLVSLYALAGAVDSTAKAYSTSTTHLFNAAVYALPMIGAILADGLLGKYRTIFWLSLVYCAGHGVLALVDLVAEPQGKLWIMYVGLGLIAVGSGGIKPCVSANVGDQFGKANASRLRTVYQIFYFSINFGSFFAYILTPIIKDAYGPTVAFGVPGVLMLLSTVIFWMGRRQFVHVPPKPGGRVGLLDVASSVSLFMTVGHFFFTPGLLRSLETWQAVAVSVVVSAAFLALGLYLFAWRLRLQPDDGFLAVTLFALRHYFRGSHAAEEQAAGTDGDGRSALARSRLWGPAVRRFGLEATEGPVAVFKIMSVFFLVSIFWALFDQKATTWLAQAEQMDRTLWEGFTIKTAQTPWVNPFLVMVLIPLMNLAYRRVERLGIAVTALRRITVGMFITAASFVATALVQAAIDRRGPGEVWIVWQLIQYVLLTLGEVMVSVTGLEFAYSQAPKRMKSTVMGFWLLTVTAGNVLVVFLVGFKGLGVEQRFWIFAGLMAAAGALFGLRAAFYVPRDYTQG